MKLNVGCGENKLEGYINVDGEASTNPDLLLDIRGQQLPYEDGSVDLVQMFHSIEHIERKYWPRIFLEFWRVLKPSGSLFLAYPEFEICARYFLENKCGLRELWRATLYGRQLYAGDYHVTPMVTSELIEMLKYHGFKNFKHAPDPDEDHNSLLICEKGPVPMGRADLFKKELFDASRRDQR